MISFFDINLLLCAQQYHRVFINSSLYAFNVITMVNYLNHIERNSKKVGGKPVIKGTRIPVYLILELITNGWSFDDILENYPQLKKEDILAAIAYVSKK